MQQAPIFPVIDSVSFRSDGSTVPLPISFVSWNRTFGSTSGNGKYACACVNGWQACKSMDCIATFSVRGSVSYLVVNPLSDHTVLDEVSSMCGFMFANGIEMIAVISGVTLNISMEKTPNFHSLRTLAPDNGRRTFVDIRVLLEAIRWFGIVTRTCTLVTCCRRKRNFEFHH